MKVCTFCNEPIRFDPEPNMTRQGNPLCGPCFGEYLPLALAEIRTERDYAVRVVVGVAT